MPDDLERYNDLVLSILEEGRSNGTVAMGELRRTVYWIVELDTLASMEGLIGFYLAVGGDGAVHVVDSLRWIGADRCAELMERANAHFPGGRPPSSLSDLHAMVNRQGDPFITRLDEIGRLFLARPDDVDRLLQSFVARNYAALTAGM